MNERASTRIESEHLMTLHVPGGGPPLRVDAALAIYRAGAEGTVEGPRIRGRIIPPTGDWLRVMPGGTLRVDARMTIQTDDGAVVHVAYGGVIDARPEVLARMAGGATLTGDDLYFVTAPTFETGHPGYDWLNRVQAIAKVVEVKGGDGGFVRYDVHAIR